MKPGRKTAVGRGGRRGLFSGRRRPPLPEGLWRAALAATPYAGALPQPQQERLRALAGEFLRAKSFEGAAGLEITDRMRAVIALKACLPALELGLDYYDGWTSIVIYPGDFRVHEEYEDESGVVHRGLADLCGESLERGPMVLSWEAIAHPPAPDQDLVIHECAHKLDTLNGPADGFPPLPADMDMRAWARDFMRAYDTLLRALDEGRGTHLDPYAETDPAEFFAVASETFFTAPAILYDDFPDVYGQLRRFYRQDPYPLLKTPQP